jgi:hypothetical protein
MLCNNKMYSSSRVIDDIYEAREFYPAYCFSCHSPGPSAYSIVKTRTGILQLAHDSCFDNYYPVCLTCTTIMDKKTRGGYKHEDATSYIFITCNENSCINPCVELCENLYNVKKHVDPPVIKYPPVCNYCSKWTYEYVQKCRLCKKVNYCSDLCMLEDWQDHRQYCRKS